MINYIEGQVSVNGQALTESHQGYATLQPNQVLSTGTGKAEILLSPGIFLRVGDNSAVRMISPQIEQPQVELTRGEAMIEVDWMPKDERVGVIENGAQAWVVKKGLYEFNSSSGSAAVFDGNMQVVANGKTKDVYQGKEALLNTPKLKIAGFNRKAEDDLYRWSNVRAGYLAEASASTAQNYYVGGYGPYWNAGWYWDPYFDFWAWMPYDGYFYSPFGYGGFGYGGYGRYGYGYRGGFAGRGFANGGAALAPRVGFSGGFHGGGFGGGGFHGGGGGGRR